MRSRAASVAIGMQRQEQVSVAEVVVYEVVAAAIESLKLQLESRDRESIRRDATLAQDR